MDDYVVKLGWTYDDMSRVHRVTSYDTSDNVKNQVKLTYDGWGNITKSIQDHAGEAGDGDPAVEYAYEDGGESQGDDDAEYVRVKYVEYPNGRRVHYTYPSSGVGGRL